MEIASWKEARQAIWKLQIKIQEPTMRRRFVRLSKKDQAVIYGLRIASNETYRELENLLSIPKSTIHYNIDEITRRFSAEDTEQQALQQLVYFVLVGVFVGKGSARGLANMSTFLSLSGVSHPTVLKVLQLAGEAAEELTSKLYLGSIKCPIFDEIFKKSSPILAMADPNSGLVILKNAEDRSSQSWKGFLEELKKQGLDPIATNTDGGLALLSALKQVFPNCVKIRDLFHVLYKMSKALRMMENICYKLILKVDKESDPEERENLDDLCHYAILTYDSFSENLENLKSSSYFENPIEHYSYVDSNELAKIIERCIDDLNDFTAEVRCHKAIKDAKNYLVNGKEAILSYKKMIEQNVTAQFGHVYSQAYLDVFIQIAELMDKYQRSYESIERKDFFGKKAVELINSSKKILGDEATKLGIEQAWSIFKSTVKSNSYIESVNSVIRTHLDTHKSIPSWLCPLFTFFWNNRIFERGKRAGRSPLDWIEDNNESNRFTWIEKLMDKFPFHKLRKGLQIREFKEAS